MSLRSKLESLRSILSERASINLRGSPEFSRNTPRWSEFAAPEPGAIVNVAVQTDVEKTIQWAVKHDVQFVAQTGGHGWTTQWNIGESDIIINMRGLNSVEVNLEKGYARIGGGAIIREVIDAAYAAKAHVVVGNCNSVGVCGAMLGGGFSRLQANFSLSIDNIQSLRLVTADGELINVSSSENSELFWALKGAGHNFGIVTSVVVNAFPQINGGVHWESMMVFLPAQLEGVARAINELEMGEGMSIHFAFTRLPGFKIPTIVLQLWYAGTPSAAEAAYASLFALWPISYRSRPTPYNEINTELDRGQFKGGQKPTWSVALERLEPFAVRELWNHFVEFRLHHPSAKDSVVMFECYAFGKARQVPSESSAFPWRHLNFHVCASLFYTDSTIDVAATEWGGKFRSILQKGSGSFKKPVYVNYATGDETLEEVYGYNKLQLRRLRELKAKWDPQERFSHFHPIY